MGKTKVTYLAGESKNGVDGVDYMLVSYGDLLNLGIDVDYGTELYAEHIVTEDTSADEREGAIYDWLKAEILTQAETSGVPAEMLEFHWG